MNDINKLLVLVEAGSDLDALAGQVAALGHQKMPAVDLLSVVDLSVHSEDRAAGNVLSRHGVAALVVRGLRFQEGRERRVPRAGICWPERFPLGSTLVLRVFSAVFLGQFLDTLAEQGGKLGLDFVVQI